MAAAKAVSDPGSILSSTARGASLCASKAGNPVAPMDAEKYGSIVLYTGNSIYRALNTALRTQPMQVPRYFGYLRLFFEAVKCMPKQKTKLWRGIAATIQIQRVVRGHLVRARRRCRAGGKRKAEKI